MALEFIIAVVCAIICVVCGYYVGVIAGKQETCDIVKENNKEVLIAREHIEYQIQNEKAHLKSLQENVEQQKRNFEDFEKLEKENIMKNLRDFQIQVNEDKAEYVAQIQLLQGSLDKLQRQKAAAVEAFQREQMIQDSEDNYRIVVNRFTQHCLCGCGIKTPKDNKLYAAMLKDGLDQFTFEIVEICPQEELNEKEKYYIDVYNAVNYGFNSQDGVNGKSND